MSPGRRLALACGALLAWSTAVVPRLPPAPAARTGANLAATAVLLGAVRLPAADIWGGRRSVRRGVAAGGLALAAAAVGYATALRVPAARRAMAATGAGTLSVRQVAVRAGVVIPLGTVLCEEVAFRGVLLALADRALPPERALAVTSAVFGLWHVGSARHPVGPPEPVPAPPAGVVAATAAAGVLFGLLRRGTGSLLAPIGLHLGANGAGLVAAGVAGRRSGAG